MTPRVWLRAFGLSPGLAWAWASCVIVGLVAPLLALRVQALSRVGAEDLTWSVAILAACISWAVISSLLGDRLALMSATAARWPWQPRLMALEVATVMSGWPMSWLVLGAPSHVVIPTVALGLAIIGAGASVGRWAPRWSIAPAIVVVALAMMPVVLPATLHPFTPQCPTTRPGRGGGGGVGAGLPGARGAPDDPGTALRGRSRGRVSGRRGRRRIRWPFRCAS